MTPLNATRCELGEGAFWHPERAEFFWFDITASTLHALAQSWTFDEMVSAAGWIDRDRMLMASETRLAVFDLRDGTLRTLCALEADTATTRSNDGRADPQGGFWIGTMSKRHQKGAGSIWRWHEGELRRLFSGISIPNAICFAPDGRSACFTDTPTRIIQRVPLDAQGWPAGQPVPFIDLRADELNPDGAVFDAAGTLWVAQWGAGRVAAHGPDGTFLQAVTVPAPHTSCPAFGGPGLRDLYCTTAREGRQNPHALDGATFCVRGIGRGQAEHRVLL